MVSSPLFRTHCGATNMADAAFCYACGRASAVPGKRGSLFQRSELLTRHSRVRRQIGTGAASKAEDLAPGGL